MIYILKKFISGLWNWTNREYTEVVICSGDDGVDGNNDCDGKSADEGKSSGDCNEDNWDRDLGDCEKGDWDIDRDGDCDSENNVEDNDHRGSDGVERNFMDPDGEDATAVRVKVISLLGSVARFPGVNVHAIAEELIKLLNAKDEDKTKGISLGCVKVLLGISDGPEVDCFISFHVYVKSQVSGLAEQEF